VKGQDAEWPSWSVYYPIYGMENKRKNLDAYREGIMYAKIKIIDPHAKFGLHGKANRSGIQSLSIVPTNSAL